MIDNPVDQNSPLQSLTKRVDKLEKYVGIGDFESAKLKRSRGGDRACWFPIRAADYPSREEWCTPGGVFGFYSDGVGPLRSKKEQEIHNYVAIVVYSTDPDTVEEHPNPDQPDHYVRVVMVVTLPFSFTPHCLSDRRSSRSIETKASREVEETWLYLSSLCEPGG